MNDDELTKIALGFVMRSKEKVLSKATGTTPWGRFACIVSASIAWLTHVWVINKGPDTVIAVHVGPNPASEVEISELKQIVMQISVVEA